VRAWAFSLSRFSIAGAFGGLILRLLVGCCLLGPGLPREELYRQRVDSRIQWIVISEISPSDVHIAHFPFAGFALRVVARVFVETACVPALAFLGQIVNVSTSVALC